MKRTLVFVMLAITIAACNRVKTLSPDELASYESEVNAWHTKRIENVKAPNGWLNLVGLYWLEPGANSFGSGESNSITFPAGKISEHAGYFTLKGNTVTIHADQHATITSEGNAVTDQVIYHPDSSKAVVLVSGSLQWSIIKRDDKLGIRLRDHENELLQRFQGIERYPINPDYRVESSFEPGDTTRTIDITNILGQTTPQKSPGALVFELGGKQHRLDVLSGNDEEFFVIFSDATSGKETYGGDRFLYVKKPADGKTVIVDFNKAYNPPCVFTPYATCPLPPKQNELMIEINAGEKSFEL